MRENNHAILLDTLNFGQITDSTEKLKPRIVNYRNKTKSGVDTVDQMLRMFSTRCGQLQSSTSTTCWICVFEFSDRLPVVSNEWNLHQERFFALCLIKQLCKVESIQCSVQLNPSRDNLERKRKKWYFSKCRNKSYATCNFCSAEVTGNHSSKEKVVLMVCTTFRYDWLFIIHLYWNTQLCLDYL